MTQTKAEAQKQLTEWQSGKGTQLFTRYDLDLMLKLLKDHSAKPKEKQDAFTYDDFLEAFHKDSVLTPKMLKDSSMVNRLNKLIKDCNALIRERNAELPPNKAVPLLVKPKNPSTGGKTAVMSKEDLKAALFG